MIQKIPSRLLWVLAAVVVLPCIFLVPPRVLAQALTQQQGLTISPFLLERQMQKGGSSDEIIDIANTSDRTLPVVISVNDFIPVGEDGQQQFVSPGQGDPRYSLSSWINFTSDPKPLLVPGEKTSIHFTIRPPADAEDGGHYGAILFTFQSSPQAGTGSVIVQKLGAIILVKLGKALENGQISKFGPDHSFYQYPPVTFTTRFKNTGNVHVAPRGSIAIYNMFGREIATTLVNENANNVLANTERQFISTWNSNFAFGLYHAKLKLIYGDSGSVDAAEATFWVLPWKTALLFGLLLFIFILIFTHLVRRYNRWLLNKAYGNQNKKR
jgi:hypothetical protein